MTVDELERRLSWTSGRAIDALETLLKVSLCGHLSRFLSFFTAKGFW